jgi:hypothetical protein
MRANTRAWIEFYSSFGGDTSIGELLPQRLTRAGFDCDPPDVQVESLIRGIAGGIGGVGLIQDFGPRFAETVIPA